MGQKDKRRKTGKQQGNGKKTGQKDKAVGQKTVGRGKEREKDKAVTSLMTQNNASCGEQMDVSRQAYSPRRTRPPGYLDRRTAMQMPPFLLIVKT